MRSARTLLVTAAASAVLALGAPAYAAGSDHDDTSYSKEQGKEYGEEQGKEHGKDWQDSPHGGMHTGGGALAAVKPAQDGREKDSSWSGKQEESGSANQEEGWSGKQDENSWSGDHEKPRGGMHTGGGALADPTVTAGGLAVVALAGAGLYAARRRKPAGSVA
ncbi:hypothetical protein RKD23_007338 [Streptomyces sp. SAI-170]|uniref:hypothetical protein n=1 Tax=Streptomyces sp. SAI-170 TaxID=3377729 RepID=UPI003C7DE617